ncbi:cyclic AMP-responsive element-binding protein 3-like protein 2 [Octopus bimaculoides]|nr:cyclic AMP-responsive element-binding protein 3-like protein 2 [Octopus bimaculoides]
MDMQRNEFHMLSEKLIEPFLVSFSCHTVLFLVGVTITIVLSNFNIFFFSDIDTDIFDSNHGALDLSQKNYAPAQIIIKQEPSEKEKIANSTRASNNTNIATVANITNSISNNSSSCNNIVSAINANITNISEDDNNIISNSNSIDSPLSNSTTLPTSNVQPTLIFSTTTSCPVKTETPILPNISIKSEPTEFMDTSSDHSGYESMNLPPTPPSSNTSDSEGSFSPLRSAPSSPVRPVSTAKPLPSNSTKHISQPLFTNPIPQSGYLVLSEEEKRTLIAEGYPIPGKLPLTKQEEKNLKKIRRKIKNKISAQESRRKKKEYLETLEKQVEAFTQENVDLKKKVDSLETNNRSLIGQLQKLQAQCGKIPRSSSASSTQTGTVLMVVVLSFAVFLGSWAPTSLNIGYSSPSNQPDIFYSNPRPMHPSPSMGPQLQNVRVADYPSHSMKSRVLLSVRDELEGDGLFGPNVPMKNTADHHADSPLKANKSHMGTKPIMWQLLSFKVPYIVNFPLTNSSRLELPFSIALQDNFHNKQAATGYHNFC